MREDINNDKTLNLLRALANIISAYCEERNCTSRDIITFIMAISVFAAEEIELPKKELQYMFKWVIRDYPEEFEDG